MDIFTILFYQPIYNLLIVLYRLFSDNLGLAIIIVALLSRLITLPITIRQMKMMGSNKEMQKKMNEIKKKYKNNKEKLQQEQMKIQSEYLPSQLAGCLPAILQLVLFINVYNVINNIIAQGVESFNVVAYSFVPGFDPSYHLNTNFLGIFDLKTSAASVVQADGAVTLAVVLYLGLIVLVAASQYLSMKYMTGGNMMMQSDDKQKENDKNKSKNKDKKDKEKPEDFASIVQQSSKQTAFLFPMMIGLISYNVASGLAFYWIAQSGFVIIQQFVTKRINKSQIQPSVV